MRHPIFKQNKRVRLKRKKMIIKAWLIAGVVTLVFVLIVWGAHNERIRIVDINIEGNEFVIAKKIQNIAQAKLKGSYFYIFPKNNIFIYPKKQIENKIKDVFERIYIVEINISNLNSITINVKERKPYLLWCGERKELKESETNNSCYFVDKKGFIFAQAPLFSNNVYFTAYGKLNKDKEEILGNNFLNEKRFIRLIQLRDLLAKEGIDTTTLTQKDNGDFEFMLAESGKLIFNESQDIKKLLRNLSAAVEVKKNEGKDIKNKLEYIDARFNNKIFFKFIQ